MTGRILLALYLVAFAALLALVFVLNFDERTDFNYWPGHRLEQVPLVYLVLGGLVIGAVYASLVAFIEQARLSFANRSLKRRLARLEQAEAGRLADGVAVPTSTDAAGKDSGGEPPLLNSGKDGPWNP